MQQTTSMSKVKNQGIKHRKLNSSRNIIGQKQGVKPIMRLKSTHEVADNNNQTTILTKTKPRSSMSKRPVSTKSKHTETVHSVATTSSAKSQGEVKEIICSVFNYSKTVHKFIEENNLDEHESLDKLLSNELFTLSLVTMLGNKNSEQSHEYVENSCMKKLQKTLQMSRQTKKCDQIEGRISKLIDRRLKELSKI